MFAAPIERYRNMLKIYEKYGQICWKCFWRFFCKVHALSTDCAYIAKVAELRGWPLKCLQRRQDFSKTDFVVISSDGMINSLEIEYGRCSHIHMGIYASRESLVNVSVRVLERNREVTQQFKIANKITIGVYSRGESPKFRSRCLCSFSRIKLDRAIMRGYNGTYLLKWSGKKLTSMLRGHSPAARSNTGTLGTWKKLGILMNRQYNSFYLFFDTPGTNSL